MAGRDAPGPVTLKAGELRTVEDVARMITRAFYEKDCVVVMDGLLHLTGGQASALQASVRDEDLSSELKLQNKIVRRALCQLERDNLVKSFQRKEMRGRSEIQQQYWRVDYKLMLDSTKLRIHAMKDGLQKAPPEKMTRHVCPTCTDEDGNHPFWDEFDVQALLDQDLMMFVCEHCQTELEEKSEVLESDKNHGNIHQRLQAQLQRLIEALKRTEMILLPAPLPEATAKIGLNRGGDGGGAAGEGGADGETVYQGKKIVLSFDDGAGAAAQPWLANTAPGGAQRQQDAAVAEAAIGSFAALHKAANDQTPAGRAAADGSAAAPVDETQAASPPLPEFSLGHGPLTLHSRVEGRQFRRRVCMMG
jgi:transcription initiation factor IIE alpha subunit